MYIIIDDTLPDLATEVAEEIRRTRPNELVFEGSRWASYRPGIGTNVVERREAPTVASSTTLSGRLEDNMLSSKGVRFWHNGFEDKLSPTYAGKPTTVEAILREAAYAEMRAEYLQSFGVQYLGRSYVAPRNVVLVDSEEDYRTILKNLPTGDDLAPWSSTAFVAAPNLRTLRKFVDDHFDTNFLAYSTKDKNRLKKIGVDVGELPKPTDEPAYGVRVRSTASLMRPFEVS